jgi:hypothetical protein
MINKMTMSFNLVNTVRMQFTNKKNGHTSSSYLLSISCDNTSLRHHVTSPNDGQVGYLL